MLSCYILDINFDKLMERRRCLYVIRIICKYLALSIGLCLNGLFPTPIKENGLTHLHDRACCQIPYVLHNTNVYLDLTCYELFSGREYY